MTYFFYRILGFLLLLNVLYKSYIYYTYNKYEATVIGYDASDTGNYLAEVEYNDSRSDYVKAPIVAYWVGNTKNVACQDQWKYLNFLRINDTTTLLVDKKSDAVELSTFTQFWFTYYNLLTVFVLTVFGTVFLTLCFPEATEKKPKTWK